MKHRMRPSGWLVTGLAGLVLVAGASSAQEAPGSSPETPAPPSPVFRAEVCTAVTEREPVGSATRFVADVGQLYCFTEIRGADGTSVTHAWIHEGTTRARVELPVRSARWRTWSSKQILPEWTGSWQVKILDADGVVLETLEFVVE